MKSHKRKSTFWKFLVFTLLLSGYNFAICQDFIFTYTGPDTISVGDNCVSPLNWGHPDTPTAESNIPGGVVDSFYIFSISGGYSIDDSVPAFTIVDISYKAVDNMGNIDFFNFSIEFIDEMAPEFIDPPSDFEVECSETTIEELQAWYDNAGGAIAGDNCGAAIITAEPDWPTTMDLFIESMNSFCGNTGIVTVSYFITDDSGNQNPLPGVATFNSVDNTKPKIIVNPMDLIINCDSLAQGILNQWVDNVGGAQAEDDCSDEVEWVSFIWSDVNGNSGSGVSGIGPYIDIDEGVCDWSVSVSFIVTDDCENLNATVASTFEIFDDEMPQLMHPPQDTTLQCDVVPTLEALEVYDNCLGTSESDFEEVTTQSDDTEDCEYYNFELIRSWTFSDSCGNTAEHTQNIIVLDTLPPTFIEPADVSINCRDLSDLSIVGQPGMVSDNCTEVPEVTFLDQIDSTLCNGIISRTWVVSDVCGNSSSHLQTIVVVDTIPPVILFEAEDVEMDCDSSANFEESFQDWLSLAGGAQSSDECDEVIWFAAVPGSYDLSDASSFPGTPVGMFDASECEADNGFIIRTEEVDYVFYDICGNASVTSAKFQITDTIAPVIIDCPLDTIIGLANADTCAGTVTIFPPQASDNCSTNSSTMSFTETEQITSSDPGNDGIAVDSVLLRFGPYSINNSPATGNVILEVALINVDINDSTEFFTITGEDGFVIGESPTGGDMCSDTTMSYINITSEQINSWGVDSFIDILFATNIPDENDTLGINDLCMESSIEATLSFDIDENQLLTYSYKIDNGAELESSLFTSIDTLLEHGLHTVEHIYTDCANNSVSCFQYFEIIDMEPPLFSCPEDFTIAVGENDCQALVAFPVEYNYFDNCGSPGSYDRTIPSNFNDALLIFNYDEESEVYIANDVTVIFDDVSGNAFGDNVLLNIEIQADGESPGEYFRIFGDNVLLGTTEAGQSGQDTVNCDSSVTKTISIPVEVFNNWATDGQVIFRAESNIGDEQSINPCDSGIVSGDGQVDDISFISMNLTYDIVIPSYYTEGVTEIERKDFEFPAYIPVEQLNIGRTSIFYIYGDASGNEDTCSFDIDIIDPFPPIITCEPLLVFIHPSGLIPIELSPADVLVDSSDNCGIDTLILEPNVFDCDNIGQDIALTLTATDFSGNESICETTIRIESTVLEPGFSQDICQSDTLFLFANAPESPVDSVYTYLWNGPNDFISLLENPIIPNISNINNGTYTVTITGFNECFATGTVEVFIEDLASPEVSSDEEEICLGSDLILNATMYNGPVTYRWYEGIFPNGVLLETTSNPQLVILPFTGIHGYYIIVESENCESSASLSVFVEVIAPPVASVEDPFISTCEGQTIILSTSVSGPNFTYEWLGPDGFISTLAQPEAIENIGLVNEGIYQLVIFNGPCSDTAYAEVEVFEKPERPVITAEDIYCEGSTVIMSVNNVPNADQYIWQRNGVTFQILNNNSLIIPNAQDDIEGDWTVVVKSGICESDTSAIREIVIEEQLTAIAVNNGPACEGDSVSLFSTFIPESNYLWEGPSEFSSTMQNPITLAQNGEYSVTITTQSGCEAIATTDVEVNMAPFITALSNTSLPCMDGNTSVEFVPSVFPPNPNYDYNWTGPLEFISTDSMPEIENFTSERNGEYTLIVSNDLCDSEPITIIIDISDIPATPTIFAESSYCIGDTFEIETNDYNNNLATYVWNTPRGQKITNEPLLVVNGAINIDGGDYSVEVLIDGCESESSDLIEIEILERPDPVNISSNSPICNTDTLRLFADFISNAVYEWQGPQSFSSNQQNPVIFPVDKNDAGEYSVRIATQGCFSIFSLNEVVEVIESPDPPEIEPFNGQVCIDGANASLELCLTEASVVEGAVYSFYNNDNGTLLGISNERCIEILDLSSFSEGVNVIHAITQKGICRSLPGQTLSISMNVVPMVEPIAGDDVIVCDEESIELDANNFPNLTGEWSSSSLSIEFSDALNPNTEVSGFDNGENMLFWTLSFQACVDFATDTVIITQEISAEANDDEYVIGFSEFLNFNPIANDDLPLDFEINIISGPNWGELTINSVSDFVFDPGEEFEGTITITYEVCSNLCPEICDLANINIKIGDITDCIIPSIITPNDDGVNDNFFIPCINSGNFPTNRLIIFNQWGDQIFNQQPYDNSWSGTYNSSKVPVGTYFYIFDPGNGEKPRNGFLIIEN